MNWIDGILLLLLLVSVIVGSKKGLVRELMAFFIFMAAIIVSVSQLDMMAVLIFDKLGGSPLIATFLAFFILIAGSYAAFKLLGMLFYKIASIKGVGKPDQAGGALIGFLRGWVTIGFVTMLAFLLPLPDAFYTAFENSFFGPTVARTIPVMYDGTAAIHPKKPNFMDQIENALLFSSGSSGKDRDILSEDRAEVYRVIYQIDRFFSSRPDK